MRLWMTLAGGNGATKRAPEGALAIRDRLSLLGADHCGGGGDGEAQDQEDGGGDAVEEAFEVYERHDTHLVSLNPRGGGAFVI